MTEFTVTFHFAAELQCWLPEMPFGEETPDFRFIWGAMRDASDRLDDCGIMPEDLVPAEKPA